VKKLFVYIYVEPPKGLLAAAHYSQHRISLMKDNRNSLLISPTLLNYIIMNEKKNCSEQQSTESSNSSEGEEMVKKEIPSISKSKLFMDSLNMANNSILNMVNKKIFLIEVNLKKKIIISF
jgi:hypothetical protein